MMHLDQHPIRTAGLAGGLLLFVHGLFPNTHAYPLLWPLVAGAVAVTLLRKPGNSRSAWPALTGALGTGALAAIVAFCGFSLAYLLLTRPEFADAARFLGANGPLPVSAVALQALGLVMLLAIPAALVGGLIALPLSRRRSG